MLWLSSPEDRAATLPAGWLIATGERPRDLPERSRLRRGIGSLILARQLGLAEADVAIGHDAAGKPLLESLAGSGLHLSLATRAGLVAVALARHPVGIDVERVEDGQAPPLPLLHPRERAALLALPSPDRALAFARLWAAKEAYVKALGRGFRRAPESFCVVVEAGDGFTVEDPERPGLACGFGIVMKNGGHETMAAAMIVLERG